MKSIFSLLAIWLALVCTSAHAAAQYPTRPIRVVVPTGAGGITDILARILAERLSPALGQPVVVDNRTGAGGIIGTEIVAKAAPDGHTVLFTFPGHVLNPSFYPSLPYDTINDFAPITIVSYVTSVLFVNSSLPVKSVSELIALAKAKPGYLNYGATRASLGHLSAELFASLAGIKIVNVPYKGAPQRDLAVMSGEIHVGLNVPMSVTPLLKTGKVRVLGVTSKERIADMPDIPTIAEAGLPGYEADGWNGVLAPAKTPQAIINQLHGEIVKVLRSRDVVQLLAAQGVYPVGNTPAEFAAIIKNDIEKWAKVIKSAGIKIN